MAKKIVVLGAGIAGCIAYNTFKSENVQIIEKKPIGKVIQTHSAIMRLRDQKVADLLGADTSQIEIEKGIFHNGKFYDKPNILLNNLYSIKLYGSIGKRSLLKPGTKTRFIFDNGFPSPPPWVIRQHNILKIEPGAIVVEGGAKIEYDYCITTVPLPIVFHHLIGAPESLKKVDLKSIPVYVKRWQLYVPSTVNQTISFPSNSHPIYRITVQGKTVIAESIGKDFGTVVDLLVKAFGIDQTQYSHEDSEKSKIQIGKIIPAEEDWRLKYIMWLTDNYGIFSFGRFATWRPLRTDELLDDVKTIKRIINSKGIRGMYENRIPVQGR